MARQMGTPIRLSNALSRRLFAAVAVASLLLFPAVVHAEEELYCEVMTVEGTATLSNAVTSGKALAEGDLLSEEDVVEVGASSYVDLAYDKDWNNVTRIEENSTIRIRSLSPPEVGLESGGLFAKLKSLPKDSSFNVQTPTAIASVRGTEYRTTFLEGETQVYNVSDSDVYVYGVDDSGEKQQAEPVVVRNSQKTFVPRRGEAPRAPQRMEQADIHRAAGFKQGIEQKIKQNIARGRVGKLPNVGEVGKRIQERQQNRMERQGPRQGPGGERREVRPQGPSGQQQQQQRQDKPSQARPAGRPRAQH